MEYAGRQKRRATNWGSERGFLIGRRLQKKAQKTAVAASSADSPISKKDGKLLVQKTGGGGKESSSKREKEAGDREMMKLRGAHKLNAE